MDHRDDKLGYLGPSHARCNVRAAARLGNERMREKKALAGRARVLGKSRRTLGIGDYFGEMGLIDGEPRSATIAAAAELETMKLARRPFLKLLEQEPQIAVSMMAELAARIRSLERRPIL